MRLNPVAPIISPSVVAPVSENISPAAENMPLETPPVEGSIPGVGPMLRLLCFDAVASKSVILCPNASRKLSETAIKRASIGIYSPFL